MEKSEEERSSVIDKMDSRKGDTRSKRKRIKVKRAAAAGPRESATTMTVPKIVVEDFRAVSGGAGRIELKFSSGSRVFNGPVSKHFLLVWTGKRTTKTKLVNAPPPICSDRVGDCLQVKRVTFAGGASCDVSDSGDSSGPRLTLPSTVDCGGTLDLCVDFEIFMRGSRNS